MKSYKHLSSNRGQFDWTAYSMSKENGRNRNASPNGSFEFVFSDGLSFKEKYKIDTEPGTMRSKWDGQITNLNNTEAIKDKTTEEKNDVKTVSEKKNGIAK